MCIYIAYIHVYIFPKQSLAVGVLTVLVKGPWTVRRHVCGCGRAFSLVIYSDSWPHHQKHIVKSPIWGTFCIWCGSGDDLWERCLLKLPGLLDVSWVPPGCLLGASWVPLGCFLGAFWMPPGCFLGASCRIQECLFRKYKNPFWIPWENKSLWNEFLTNEKCKSGFTPKTSIRLVDTIVNRHFYQKPDIEYSSVRSFCPWRFVPNIA